MVQNHSVTELMAKFIQSSTEVCPFSERALTNGVGTSENEKKREHQNCALLDDYAARSDNSLPTFRDKLSVPSSGFKNQNPSFGLLSLENVTDRLSQTSAKNYHCLLRNYPEKRSFNLLRGGNLESRTKHEMSYCFMKYLKRLNFR